MEPVIILISIIITLAFSAFFSGMEIAFISANRLKIALDDKQGGVKAKILAYFAKKPASFIGTMLLGNNAAIVAYSMFMAMAIDDPLTELDWNGLAGVVDSNNNYDDPCFNFRRIFTQSYFSH